MTSWQSTESASPLLGLLDEVVGILASADATLAPLLQVAATAEREARARREELEQFLEVLALDSDLISSGASEGFVDGTRIDLDAMRADVVRLAQASTRATTLRDNISIMIDLMRNAEEHFSSDAAFTRPVDAGDERISSAMVAAREEERRRLAREIHDGPAQVLTNAIYAIQIVEQVAKRNPEQVGDELKQIRDLLKDGITEVRRFMFDLVPTMLQDQGLGPTFRRYVEDHARFFGRTIKLDLDTGLPRLTPQQDLTVFRIMQESLQNIHKHAGVSASAKVSLRIVEDGLVLEIQDNGAGFDPAFAIALHSSGSGLGGMRERALLVGGTLDMSSSIGEGTTVRLHIQTESRSPRAEGPHATAQGDQQP